MYTKLFLLNHKDSFSQLIKNEGDFLDVDHSIQFKSSQSLKNDEEEFKELIKNYFDEQLLLEDLDLSKINSNLHPILSNIKHQIKIYKRKKNCIYFKDSQNIKITPILNDYDQYIYKYKNQNYSLIVNNAENVVIDIPKKDLSESKLKKIQKPKDSLTKEQLQSIRQKGEFTVYTQNQETQVWKVQNSFFNSDRDYIQRYQKQFEDLKSEILSRITSKDTQKWIKTKIWKKEKNPEVYQNLHNSLMLILFTPYLLLNALIGVPYKIFKNNKISIQIQIKKEIENVQIHKKEQNFLNFTRMLSSQTRQQNLVSQLFKQLNTLKWSKEIYDNIEHLKLILMIDTFDAYFKSLKRDDIMEQQLASFLQEFKAFMILKYFNHLLQSNCFEERKKGVIECMYWLKKYKLDIYEQQYHRILEVINKTCNAKPQKEDKIEYLNDLNSQRYSYFWKLKFHCSKFQFCQKIQKTLLQVILDGKYGLKVCFGKKTVVEKVYQLNFQHKSLHQRFQQIKEQIKINQNNKDKDQEDDENDDGGIFGECCQRFQCFFYISNYFCVYFLKGIIYINIFLRIVCLFQFIIIFSLLIFSCMLNVFSILTWLVSILICDFSIPEEQSNKVLQFFPQCVPLISIFFIPIKGILRMFFQFFLLTYSVLKYFFYYFQYATLRIKDSLKFCLIRIFAQIPLKDSQYCKLVQPKLPQPLKQLTEEQQNNKLLKSCYLDFEQIKILVNVELDLIKIKSQELKVKNTIQRRLAEYNSYLRNLEKYLPFDKQQNQIQIEFDKQSQRLTEELEESFKGYYKNQYEIQLKPGYKILYDYQQFLQIDLQVQDYLKQLFDQRKQDLTQFFKITGIKLYDFKKLSHYLLQNIFKPFILEDTSNKLYEQMTALPLYSIQSVKEVNLNEINKFIQINFNYLHNMFNSEELNINNTINEFNTWSQSNKYYYYYLDQP